jgi:hypothetical protein
MDSEHVPEDSPNKLLKNHEIRAKTSLQPIFTKTLELLTEEDGA